MRHNDPQPKGGQELSFEYLITQLQAAVSQSINGVTLRGSLARPIGSVPPASLKPVGSGTPGRLMSVEVRETTTTNPILVRLYDGDQDPDRLLCTIPLAAGAGSLRNYPGVSFTRGITVALTALDGVSVPLGACEGVVYIGAAAEGS